MTSDQLPPNAARVGMIEATQDLSPLSELGQSFGLGFAVRTDLGHSAVSGSVGDHFWAGAAGTYFWIDPQEKLYAVMTCRCRSWKQAHTAARCARSFMGRWYTDGKRQSPVVIALSRSILQEEK